MLRYLFLFGLLQVAHGQANCPGALPAYQSCNGKTIILLDATSWIPNDNYLTQEFDYVLNAILPHVDFENGDQVSVGSYGTSSDATVFAFQAGLRTACEAMSYLIEKSNQNGRHNYTILSGLNGVFKNFGNIKANLVVFSNSKDRTDITNSFYYLRSSLSNVNYAVVTPNDGYFGGWGCPVYITNFNNPNQPIGLPYCLISECNSDYDYDIIMTGQKCNPLNPPPNPYSRSSSTPSSIGIPFSEYECKCVYNQIWNDIIYIFATSSSISRNGLVAAVNNMKSSASLLNVQKSTYSATKNFAQVGVIGYGSTATVIASLGSVDNNGLQSVQVPYTGDHDSATNLESAIRLAIAQFSSNGRKNSKPVIQVYASSYSSAGVNSPNVIANQFKEYGIMIVYDYVEANGAPDPQMQQIATQGYFIDSRTSDGYASIQAQCDANCFCGSNEQFMTNTTRKIPTRGCFRDYSGAPATYSLAMNTCSDAIDDESGVVAMDYSPIISTFLNSFSVSTQMWNGLQYDDRRMLQYMWADETPFSWTSSSYSPWNPSIPPPSGKECTMMARSSGNTMKWFQQQCSSILPYICQLSPCDSTRWCDRLNAN